MKPPWWTFGVLFGSAPAVGQVRCAYQNFGDILVHRAIDRLASGVRIVTYDDRDRTMRWLDRTVGLRRVLPHGMLGGGTLIFSPRNVGWLGALESLLQRAEPLCTFGTGVVDPDFVDRVYRAAARSSPVDADALEGWLALLRRFPLLGVRGLESARILKEHGIDSAEVIGDPALVFARESVVPKPRRKRIGVSVLDESHFWPGTKERAVLEMKRFVRALVDDGWDVALMPACDADLALATALSQEIGHAKLSIFSAFRDTDAYLAAVGERDVFVGMRLHSFVAACCTHTPGIMVGYQPKCLDFTRTVGLERSHVPTDQVDADLLMARVAELYDSIDDAQQQIAVKCAAMKKRLEDFAARVLSRLAAQGA